MLTKEFGINNLLDEVFKNKDVNVLSNLGYVELYTTSASFTKFGKNMIIQHIKNNTNHSIEFMCAAFVSCASSPINHTYIKALTEMLINNSNNLLTNLDTTYPIINDSDLYLNHKDIYLCILNNKNLSFTYLDKLTNNKMLHHDILFKELDYYGIAYLLSAFCKYDYDNFYKWFSNTKREDLKLAFCYALVKDYQLNSKIIFDYTNSEIFFLRVLAKLMHYKIHFSSAYAFIKQNKGKSIKDLQINDENIYLTLYGIQNYCYNPDKELANKMAEESIGLLSNLSFDVFKKEILNLNDEVIIFIMKNIKLDDANTFYEFLFDYLEDRLNNNNNNGYLGDYKKNSLFYYTVLKMYEELFKCDKYINKLKISFDFFEKEMNKPYAIYKDTKTWNKNLNIMFNYLCILFIRKDDDILEYISRYKKVLKELPLRDKEVILKKFNEIYEELMKHLKII